MSAKTGVFMTAFSAELIYGLTLYGLAHEMTEWCGEKCLPVVRVLDGANEISDAWPVEAWNHFYGLGIEE